jgi:hypothetical protein
MRFVGHPPAARITRKPRSEREAKARALLLDKRIVAVDLDDEALTLEVDDGSKFIMRYQGPMTETH